MVIVGSAGESEMSRNAGPTNRADAPLPLVHVRVVVRLVATPAVMFVVAGAAARTVQVFVAAEARWGIARYSGEDRHRSDISNQAFHGSSRDWMGCSGALRRKPHLVRSRCRVEHPLWARGRRAFFIANSFSDGYVAYRRSGTLDRNADRSSSSTDIIALLLAIRTRKCKPKSELRQPPEAQNPWSANRKTDPRGSWPS